MCNHGIIVQTCRQTGSETTHNSSMFKNYSSLARRVNIPKVCYWEVYLSS